jgi:uncharacterized membrane protein
MTAPSSPLSQAACDLQLPEFFISLQSLAPIPSPGVWNIFADPAGHAALRLAKLGLSSGAALPVLLASLIGSYFNISYRAVRTRGQVR